MDKVAFVQEGIIDNSRRRGCAFTEAVKFRFMGDMSFEENKPLTAALMAFETSTIYQSEIEIDGRVLYLLSTEEVSDDYPTFLEKLWGEKIPVKGFSNFNDRCQKLKGTKFSVISDFWLDLKRNVAFSFDGSIMKDIYKNNLEMIHGE